MPWTPLTPSEANIAEIKAWAMMADQVTLASQSENTCIACGKAWRACSEWCLDLDQTGSDLAAAADEHWLVLHLTLTPSARPRGPCSAGSIAAATRWKEPTAA